MSRIDQDHELVVSSLREAGVHVSDVYELVNGVTPREAVPILIELLPLLDNNAVKEGVIRALGDKTARGIATRPLLRELKSIGAAKPLLGWAIANSLAEIVDANDFEDLRSLVHEPTLAKAREMLVVALGRTRHPDAVAELVTLTGEPGLEGYVVIAAGELGASQLRPFVERQLKSDKGWVRKEAKKALRRVEASAQKK